MTGLFPITLLSVFLLAGIAPDFFYEPPTAACSGQGQTGSPATDAEVLQLNKSITEFFRAEKYDEALPLAKRALELQQNAYGPSDPHTAAALHNLAEIYFAKGNFREAEKLFKQALAIYERGSERESLVVSSTLERLAAVAYESRDYAKAAPLLERSLAIREKLLGRDDLQVAETLTGLGQVYGAERRNDLARPLSVRALTIKEAKFGPSDPKTVEAMKTFACVDLFTRSSRDKTDPALEEEIDPVVRKSYCWLGGFKEDCATAPMAKSQGVLNGKALKLPAPQYSFQARSARAQGRVLVAVLIDERGRVSEAKAVCGGGHPALTGVSVAAALEAVFTPTMIGGKPVQVTGVITYNFIVR